MAADGSRVARAAHVADDLTDLDEVAAPEPRRMAHVRVPVLAPLPQPPDHDEVSVETAVVRPLDDRPGDRGRERRPAVGDDVEALVPAPAVTQRAELPHRAARSARTAYREEVPVQLHLARIPLVSSDDADDHPISAVGDEPAAVGEAVPALDQAPAWRCLRDVDRPDLPARARDPDRDVGGRRAAEPIIDPDPAGRVG